MYTSTNHVNAPISAHNAETTRAMLRNEAIAVSCIGREPRTPSPAMSLPAPCIRRPHWPRAVAAGCVAAAY